MMPRGPLEIDELTRVSQLLPEIRLIQEKANGLWPDQISANFPYESSIPGASVCFHDSTQVLAEARYAMHEYHAHHIWYREKVSPPDTYAAVFFERFYLDDVALRLYATGEHLTSAVTAMLSIEQELRAEKTPGRSWQAALVKLLSKNKHPEAVAVALSVLGQSKEWRATMKYRGRWVHDQPPLMEGQGIRYRRGQRWEQSGKTWTLRVGAGDPTESTTGILAQSVGTALMHFTQSLTGCLDYYLQVLGEHGFSSGSEKLPEPPG